MYPLPSGSPSRRQGVILLVVVSLLTLFAIVGLSFVLYAESAAKSAHYHRLAEYHDRPDAEAELLLKFFLGQFIYGTDDVFSAMRGHSLAENMYGYDNRQGAHNTTPYTGMGRYQYQYPRFSPPPPAPQVPLALRSQENFDLVNYTAFGSVDNPIPFIRDPQRLGWRGTPEHAHYVCGSVPYTYPDANNMFLGAADANGNVLARSFHRDWTGGDPNDPITLRGFGPLWENGRPNRNWELPDPSLKYKTLRPRPAEHRGPNGTFLFPPPADEGGDVKNLASLPGPNDSIWIDLNFPVQKTPDGRKYKPLFAAFIEDLDNRVNVNVHGNTRGVGGGWNWPGALAGGHQAWGPWEVNLEHVLRYTNNTFPEAKNIFIGNGLVRGRYEVRRPPEEAARQTGYWGDNTFRILNRRLAFGPFYSRTNTDGNPHNGGDAETHAIRLPGVGPAGTVWHRHHSFPHYNGAYANADQGTEARNNPLIFNFFDPGVSSYTTAQYPRLEDRTFPHSNLEALLRYGDTGAPAHTSDLFLLCPNTFRDYPRSRRLVSTIGFDVDRPGVIPSEWNPLDSLNNPVPYVLREGEEYPHSPAQPRPGFPLPPQATLGEFRSDGRALTAALGRINMNRLLPEYPRPVAGRILDFVAFNTAQQARQEFATEIYQCLRQVTGAYNPYWPNAFRFRLPEPMEADALRWLAQLAVNIVDFIDQDDYMTPFHWGGIGSTLFTDNHRTEWVYGTELPRLVLNEVYTDAMDIAGDRARYRFWIELHNPLHQHPAEVPQSFLIEGGSARLQVPDVVDDPGWGAYQIVIADGPDANDDRLRLPNNVVGELDDVRIKKIVNEFRQSTPPPLPDVDYHVVTPVRLYDRDRPPPAMPLRPPYPGIAHEDPLPGFYNGNEGYYVLGPKDPEPSLPGDERTSLRLEDMEYVEPGAADTGRLHTLLLRRLACPHRPYRDVPFLPGFVPNPDYNPYVTVDYLSRTPPAQSGSWRGRRQPYQAVEVVDQNSHSLFQVNLPNERYNWLVFHDRPLINALELLDVSAFKPHQLTQKFRDRENGRDYEHRALWLNPETRLYRFLEFVEGGELQQGVTTNGRAIGKLNLNTIWDVETFRALVNRKDVNRFSADEVNRVWADLVRSRTPGGAPGPNDKPFMPFAAPHQLVDDVVSNGVEATVLRANPNPANPTPLFQVSTGGAPNNHPYFQMELLRKVLSNSTTRSNVFGVWLTVGFFEVIDDRDKTRPPILGAELGKTENRHVRHRMFSIVDRTNLTVSPAALATGSRAPGPRPFFMNTDSPVEAGPQRVVVVPAVTANYEDLQYTLDRNNPQTNRLVMDVGPSQEMVVVDNVDIASRLLRANFTKRHQSGVPLSNVWFPREGQVLPPGPPANYGRLTMLGNPGPQPRFDPRDPIYSGIVRYMSVIVH